MKKKIRAALLFCFIIFAGVFHSCSMDRDKEDIIIEQSKPDEYKDEMAGENETIQSEEASICVFITGCIKNPGIYELSEGTRLYQLIELAGGFTDEAAQDYLNLAEYVKDGDKITVYSEEEIINTTVDIITEKESKEQYVNINTADKETLMTLPGIGEAKAEAILQYREDNGRFSAIEDIMNISGIKKGAFDKIKSLITI